MTREQVNEVLPILQAYAEGKEIQALSSDDRWVDGEVLGRFDIEAMATNSKLFRIKPQPKYRPFNSAEECWQEMQKHQPFGWLKDKNNGNYGLFSQIMLIDSKFDNYTIGVNNGWDSKGVFDHFTFADGSVFGVKEE